MPSRRAAMMGFSLAVLLLGAAVAWPRPPLPPAKGHDLRGPALAKGLKLTVKSTGEMKDAEVSLDAGAVGAKVELKVSYTGAQEKEVEVVALTGRQPTHIRTKIVKDVQKAEYTGAGAPPAADIPVPLAGHVIESKLENKKWKHSVGDKQTDEMVSALDKFGPWSPDDGMFPAKKVRIGESWDVTKQDFTTFPGGGPKIKDFEVKGKAKFLRIEKHQGVDCAVVEYTLATKGTQSDGGMDLKMDTALKMTVWRSLRHGITLRMTAEADIKATNEKVTMKMTGKQKSQWAVTIKE